MKSLHQEVSIHTSLWAHCKHPAGKRKHFLCPRITCLPIERELMFPDGAYGCGRGAARAPAVPQGSVPPLARVSGIASHVQWHLE